VDRVVGGVEVQHDLLRPCAVALGAGVEELVDQHAVHRHARLPRGPLLEPAQRRRRGQRPIRPRLNARRQLQRRVHPHRLMVVEILVARGDGEHPLSDHRRLLVVDPIGVPRVGQTVAHRLGQPQPTVHLPQQHQPGVGRQPTAIEDRLDLSPSQAGQPSSVRVTVCHADGLALMRV
jgi:hypothetical protein